MNHTTLPLSRAFAAAILLGCALPCQSPSKPPPWWGVQDDVTVSLYWNFSGPAPLQPQVVAAPPWYNPAVTRAVPTGPLQVLGSLAGHTDVLALVGTGAPLAARLDVTVDNDPHVDWVKVFWFQFDEFEGASGSVAEAIEQDLTRYKRSSVTTTKEVLGNGWNRITVSAQLFPQPTDEDIDFVFTEQALGTAAIDDLYANSKCIKLDEADQDGEALGELDGFTVDLTAATGTAQCLAAAVTEGPAPAFARTYWVSARASVTGATHQVFQLNQAGAVVSTTTLPDTLATAPQGATDLTVETVVSPTGATTQFVYSLLDLRGSAANAVLLRAIAANGTLQPARDVTIAAYPGQSPAGLAFCPHGNVGLGTFVVTDQTGIGFEFTRQGTLLRTIPNLPPNTTGAGYDPAFGNFYFFSSSPVATPSGPIQVAGYEWSGYDLQPTGVRFFGNLQLPNSGGPRGGLAGGLEIHRRANGDFRAVCVARLPAQNRSVLYELKGPFRWGQSLAGTCGMRGLPVEGSTNFQITLSGAPTAAFAALYAGFAPRSAPLSLAPFGLHETTVMIPFHLNSTLLAPTATGEFAFTLPLLPPGAGFSYVPLFFQWVVFDPSAPGGITMSPAGKTLVY
jgi:hypothetical protein